MKNLPEKPNVGTNAIEADSFIDWTIRALEYLPFNDEMKSLIDELIAVHSKRPHDLTLSSTDVTSCLEYIASVRTSVRIRNIHAQSFVRKLSIYRDRLEEYETKLKTSVKTYWLQ